MDELLAIARTMELEAISGYAALAKRMHAEKQPELASVFETLVREEQGHLENIDNWIEVQQIEPSIAASPAQPMFDDEGAALVAPELLDAYRAFSMAVRNEERAFVFWTYVAAHANDHEIQKAAERMAREELGHVATLRRERRKAFHTIRNQRSDLPAIDPATLERRLAELLDEAATRVADPASTKVKHQAEMARRRAAIVQSEAFSTPSPTPETGKRLISLCEYLLDYYLGSAERLRDNALRDLAQTCSGELVACLHLVRELPPA